MLGEVSMVFKALDFSGGWNVGQKLGAAWEQLSATLEGLTPAEAASVGTPSTVVLLRSRPSCTW